MSESPKKQQRPKAKWFGLAIHHFIASILNCLSLLTASRRIYQQNGHLVRVIPNSVTVKIEELQLQSLLYELDRVADLTHECKNKDDKTTRTEPYPRREYLEAFLFAGSWPTEVIPEIRGVSTVPFFNKEGQFIQDNGYDPVSHLYLARDPWIKHTLNAEKAPHPQISALSKRAIGEVLTDFPFVANADITHCYALLLTLFARELYTGPSPLFYIGAGKQGTGKDLLASALTTIYLGKPVDTLPPTKNEEELRKRMTSLLMLGQRCFRIGNQTKSIESASLAAFLTSDTWCDRQLGSNRMRVLENQTAAIITANNLQFDADLARRICAIRIEADVERPEERDGFKHNPLLEYCKANADQLAACVNSMIKKWIHAGRPLGKLKMGSFESWSEVIGGILEVNEITDFLGNLRDIKATSEDDAESEKCMIIEEWFRNHYCEIVQAKDVRISEERIPNLLTSTSDTGKAKQFGHVIRSLVGAVYRGFVVRLEGADHSRVKKYRLVTKPDAIALLDDDVFHRVLDRILTETGEIDRDRMIDTLMPYDDEVDKVSAAIQQRLAIDHPDKPYVPPCVGGTLDDLINA
jgi:hypothetical protein